MAHTLELHLTDEQWGLLQHCHWDMTKLGEVIENACTEHLGTEAERGYPVEAMRPRLRQSQSIADEVAGGTRSLGRSRRLRGAEPRADPG